jgi:putative transcriptional regulator
MFKINLDRLLFERKMNQRDLHRKTGIRAATINAYYNNYIRHINVSDLIKICDTLGCTLSELMEYEPKGKSSN